jgi:hypothetical protein
MPRMSLRQSGLRRDLQPFSFSTLAQAAAIGRLGVIYLLDHNDRQIGYIVNGRTARKRNPPSGAPLASRPNS